MAPTKRLTGHPAEVPQPADPNPSQPPVGVPPSGPPEIYPPPGNPAQPDQPAEFPSSPPVREIPE